MLSQNKLKALQYFIHTRLSGKYAVEVNDEQLTEDKLIKNTDEFKKVKHEMKELLNDLTQKKYTVDHLNNLPDTLYTRTIVYYYEIALKELKKNIDDNCLIIEGFLALSIISYLVEEKEIGKTSISPRELISIFEKQNYDRKLLNQMQRTAIDIVEAVDKSNYMKSIKRKKKSRAKR